MMFNSPSEDDNRPNNPIDEPIVEYPGNNTSTPSDPGNDTSNNNDSVPTGSNTTSSLSGEITIERIGTFSYDPEDIITIRPDIFQAEHFSIFDILVWLDNTSQIDMDYYYNESVNSHIIRSINNKTGWWYEAYYSGGWPELNVFRMDHYPVKDKTTIKITRRDSRSLNKIYKTWADEIERKKNNTGKVIIPVVIIQYWDDFLVFYNASVIAHDFRSDMFQPGVMTALDVVLSLADQHENFTVGLQWYESIGDADVVKSYWVERINSWQAEGRCGFVYEAGDAAYPLFQGNHIHIPSDIRVINSPEYVRYFWICI